MKKYKWILIVSSLLFAAFLIYFFKTDVEPPLETLDSLNQPTITQKNNEMHDDVCEEKTGDIPHINEGGWQLIWHDEFENNCLDFTKWHIEDWAAEKNNELQYYTPNNVEVEDGALKLTSRKERYKGRDYTSGAVHTKGKFDFLYGKVEMRAKLPAGQGIFPAFWTMTNKENTWLPEIDIMEMLGHEPNEIWMVVHWLDENGTLKSDYSSFFGSDFSKDFHTFSIEWTPESITWFVDDVERFKTQAYVPHEPMYLYLNTAIGGDWPGSPDLTTPFPVTYEIDYVRVFTKN